MKKFLLLAILGLLLGASYSSADPPPPPKKYYVRNGVLWRMYFFREPNPHIEPTINDLIDSLGGWSPYSLELSEKDFPLAMSSCKEFYDPKNSLCTDQLPMVISEPGCYVIWAKEAGQGAGAFFYYTTAWPCAWGDKPTQPQVPKTMPEKEVKKGSPSPSSPAAKKKAPFPSTSTPTPKKEVK